MTDMPKGGYARVPVELCNGRVWISQVIGVDSLLKLLREVMLIWCRRNIKKGLDTFLNRTSSEWKKFKRAGKFKWDYVSRS